MSIYVFKYKPSEFYLNLFNEKEEGATDRYDIYDFLEIRSNHNHHIDPRPPYTTTNLEP
jgi:hypothetical protein